jgi:hypothetical protein
MSRVSVLAGICAIMAVSPGAARAQAPSAGSPQTASPAPTGEVVARLQTGFPLVTGSSRRSSDRRLALTLGSPSTPLRFDQSLAGSARLGVSPAPVSPANAARDGLGAVRSASLRHRGPGVALMIVGAAGVITGLLLDESIVTVAGAGAGLVGLYLYVR